MEWKHNAMRPMKKIAASAAMVLGVLIGGAVTAAPASAATSNCPSGAACIWGDTMWKTAGSDSAEVGFQYYISNYSGYTYDGSRTAYNTASSLYNNGNTSTVRFCTGVNYSGACIDIPKKQGDGYMLDAVGTVNRLGFDDTIKSGKFV